MTWIAVVCDRAMTGEILLIEHDDADAEATLSALRGAHAVRRVHDGEEALEYLFASGRYAERDAARLPKLVLLNIRMPKVDGIELLRRIRGSELRSVPVVVMISSSEEREVLESFRLGIDRYVAKPLRPETVSEVETLL